MDRTELIESVNFAGIDFDVYKFIAPKGTNINTVSVGDLFKSLGGKSVKYTDFDKIFSSAYDWVRENKKGLIFLIDKIETSKTYLIQYMQELNHTYWDPRISNGDCLAVKK